MAQILFYNENLNLRVCRDIVVDRWHRFCFTTSILIFAFADCHNLDCGGNFSYTGLLPVSWTTCAHRSRRQSARHAGSSARQSGASRRCGGGRCQGSARFRGLLLGKSGLSRIFEACIGGPSDVPQRTRISRTARSVGSRCKGSILRMSISEQFLDNRRDDGLIRFSKRSCQKANFTIQNR